MPLNTVHEAWRYVRWGALALLLAAVVLTVRGLPQIGWPVTGPANPLYVWAAVMAVSLFAIVATGLRPAVVAAALAAVFAVAAGQAGAVLAVLLFVAASVVVGGYLLRALGAPQLAQGFVFAFVTGAGSLGTASGLLAHWPVNYPGVYGLALALTLVLDRRRCVGWFHAARDFLRGGGPRATVAQRVLEAAIVTAALVHYAVAFAPEIGSDALAVHLFIAERMRTGHMWNFDVDTYVWAVMPALVDWIYAIVDMLGGEVAARLVNVTFVLVLARMVRDLVLWAGGSSGGARWAVLLFLVTPLTFTESHTLFIEAGWSAFMVAGTFAVLKLLDSKPGDDDPDARGLLPAAGLLLGLALAAKAVTLSLLPALAIVMLARRSTWFGRAHNGTLAKALLIGIVIGGIPYLTAWVITANPVFPFFNGVFKSPLFPPENFEPPPFERYLRWDTLYRMLVESARYLEAKPGASGFQWLLLLVPCAIAAVAVKATRWRSSVLLVVGIGGVATVFQQTAYLRYIFPCVVVLMAVVGVGLTHLMERAWSGALWAGAATAAVALNIAYFHSGAAYLDLPWRAMLSQTARTELLEGRRPERLLAQSINALNAPASPVMWIAYLGAAGLRSDALYAQWYNHKFAAEFLAATTEDKMLELIGRRGVEFVVFDSQVRVDSAPALLKVTDEVANIGGVSLRRVKSGLRYLKEMAVSPDFHNAAAWGLTPGATIDSAGLRLSANSGAYQKIAVVPGRKYLNSVSVRCDAPDTTGRLQINWVDASQKILTTSAKTYVCGPNWSVNEQEVTAPSGAAYGMLYAWGQAGGPLTVRMNSLKGTP
ncbi:hypothetical protein [Caenimonas koreensis]|uniref:hypothetical protein n=1 Tax=Caenimonas koreensis TaxID=367474 RepID=UPI003783F245